MVVFWELIYMVLQLFFFTDLYIYCYFNQKQLKCNESFPNIPRRILGLVRIIFDPLEISLVLFNNIL